MGRGHVRRLQRMDGSPGSWRAVIDDPNQANGTRKQVSRCFSTKRDAVTWLEEVRSTPVRAVEGPTVDEYLQGWLEGRVFLRASSRASYEAHIRVHISPVLGEMSLGSVTAADVDGFVRVLVNRGLSASTVRHVVGTLNAGYEAAIRAGIISTNPVDGVELPPMRGHARGAWTADQARAFLTGTTADPLVAMWRLALLRGLRRGELLGLSWSDIDLDQAVLTVTTTRVAVPGLGVISGPPKSASGYRRIVLDQGTIGALRIHHRQQAADRLRAGEQWPATGLVFVDDDGQPLPPWWISKRFTQLCNDLALPAVRLHDLRHASASLGLQAGESLREVQVRLGHARISTTAATYATVPEALARSSADRLAVLLDHGPGAHNGVAGVLQAVGGSSSW